MTLDTLAILQKAFFEEAPISTYTPLWVPIAILVLMVLLFIWGITRGNVKDENLSLIDDGEIYE
ncbi:MAG: hypothetical protein ACK2TV_00620 [Anaerolineales bacterium]|jgi:hypothetical protein